MLENNEKIQGVNLSDVYSVMVKELPWAVMLSYISNNATLLKLCTIGGNRLIPNKRDRFEKIITREGEKAKYAETVCNGVFAAWYPVHKELHTALEDYFHSDEYKEFRASKGLGEDDYVLPDEKMDQLFKLDDLNFWRVLLCFSPLKFTEAQGEKILNNKAGSAELVDRLKKMESDLAELTRKNETLVAEAERLRAKQSDDAAELQELKRQNRQFKADNEQMQRKMESAMAEMRRSSQQASAVTEKQQELENQLREESRRNIARMQAELDRVRKEMQGWQVRYEEQKSQNRQLEEGRASADKAGAQLQKEKEALTNDLQRCQSFADVILSRIDWPHVGTAMKVTPTLRKNLNSLLKKLNYEEDKTVTIEGALPDFWKGLSAGDELLIRRLANSSMEELARGDIEGYWKEVAVQCTEVQQNLEARLALLDILQDLFFQTIEMEDLDASKLPSRSKTKKK